MKLVIPNNEVYNRINDKILSEETSSWLYKTYQNSPSLGELLVDSIQGSWLAVNRRVLLGPDHPDGMVLPFDWSNYKVVDIDVIEKSIPNTLLEYLDRFGYKEYFTLPDTYKMGMVITLKFAYDTNFAMVSLSRNRKQEPVTLSHFYISDIIVSTLTDEVYYYRCMSSIR